MRWDGVEGVVPSKRPQRRVVRVGCDVISLARSSGTDLSRHPQRKGKGLTVRNVIPHAKHPAAHQIVPPLTDPANERRPKRRLGLGGEKPHAGLGA